MGQVTLALVIPRLPKLARAQAVFPFGSRYSGLLASVSLLAALFSSAFFSPAFAQDAASGALPAPLPPPLPQASAPRSAAPDAPQGDGEGLLSSLIPNSAVARPDDWARGDKAPPLAPLAMPAADQPISLSPQIVQGRENSPPASISPSSPLAELPGFLVDWPNISVPLPQLATLSSDGQSTAPAPSLSILSAEPSGAQPHSQPLAERLDRLAAGRVVLAWHIAGQSIPERAVLENRFRALSALQAMPAREIENLPQLAVRAAADRAVLQQLLRTYGYYDAEAIQTLAVGTDSGTTGSQNASANANGAGKPEAQSATQAPVASVLSALGLDAVGVGRSGPLVRFDIVPGKRYRFGAIDLGPLADIGPDYPVLRKSFAIASGDPLHLDTIPVQTQALESALGESGYAFAHIDPPLLTVDHLREEGDLSLPVKPGGTYRFGAIISSNERFLSSGHLARIARFRAGQPYRRSEVDDLRRAILATGLVSSLTVTPRAVSAPALAPNQTPHSPPGMAASGGTTPTPVPDPAMGGIVALDVAMTPAPARTVSGALGYDTAQGFRLEAGWEHRNLFPPEGSLRLRGVAGTNEQLAGATLRRANFHGRDRVLTFDLYADNATLPAYAARAVDFSASYERQTTLLFQKPWSYALGLEAEASLEREGVPSGITTGRTAYLTLAAPMRATWDRSNDLLDPSRGYRIGLRLSPELSQTGGKTATYARIQMDASGFAPLMHGVVLASRLRLGSLVGAGLADIAVRRVPI